MLTCCQLKPFVVCLLVFQEDLLEVVHDLNRDPAVDGLLIQLPLPDHVSEKTICQAVNPHKDVDGFHMFNIGQLVHMIVT